MALDGNVIKERLEEIFNGESQQTVADKLNMTQGSISKILTGKQLPTLETLYHIANIYGVSVDWILGLSPVKKTRIGTINGLSSYSEMVKVISDMLYLNAAVATEKDGGLIVTIKDPLAVALIKKSTTLMNVDVQLQTAWENKSLILFNDREILEGMLWEEKDIMIQLKSSSQEGNWLFVHDMGRKRRDEYLSWFEQGDDEQNG